MRYFIVLLFFIGCDQTMEYNISLKVNPYESGSTNIIDDYFLEGEEVYIEAVPNENYEFDFWSGDADGNQPELTFKINRDLKITANFRPLDSDNDGIPDNEDLCLNSEKGKIVNKLGCYDEDQDYDNDGVQNDLDLCPRTPINTSVNNKGCALVKLDENGITLKATPYAAEYFDSVLLFKGDSIIIVKDWIDILKLGPETFDRELKIVTTFIDDVREICPLPCRISDNFDMSVWDMSNVKSMYFTFWNTIGLKQDLSKWDVSNVESMEGLFFHAYNMNVNISDWNVSNVKNMKYMFRGAIKANPDLSNWNVSNVENMKEMFLGTDIAQDLKGWNVAKVKNMEKMFYDAQYYNQDLSIWDVGNVTDCDSFYENAKSWSLPKPSFIKCNPDG